MELKLENPKNIIHAYENQEGWNIDDISLSSAGKIAFSGRHYGTHQSFVCIYSSDDNPDSGDGPALLYHKQFADKLSWPRRISFITPNCIEIVTCQNDEVHVIEHNRDVVLRSCRVIGRTTCLSVSENQIFIGIFSSDIVNIYDNDLNEIKSIRLTGIKGDWPGDISAAAEKLYVRTGGYPGKAIAYSQNSGSILTEFTTGQSNSHACSIAVNIQLELTVVLWYHLGQPKIIFYHLSENISFLTVNAEPGIVRIRISDRGRIATADEFLGGVMVYDLGSVLSYSHLKENLASRLGRDDLEKLTDSFAMEGEELNTILSSDRPAASFLFALEEKSVIHTSNVDKLEEAFRGLKLSPSFCHAVNLYQKIKGQIIAYDRFLASLSAHLTSSVPAQLCVYFHIPDERKNAIISSKNPGLSLLLILDEMGAIKSSEVGSLEEPLCKLRLVQAVAKIHEYKEILQEENRRLPQTATNNLEVNKTIFAEFLKKKIKSWYETMTPVPWKKSCQWKATDLFVGSGLILTDSKSKQNIQTIDEKCKLNYTDIFTHEKLKSEIRIKLEGDPGSGKTMLLSQLAYDWSRGKIESVDILIFLPLKIVGDKTLIQAVKEFYIPTDMAIPDKDIEAILASSEDAICLLLDGLEEYSAGKGREETKESTEVMKIMKKEKHSNCKVVISTRSDFAHDLPEFPSLKVGRFGELQRELYIKQLYADNTDQQKKVQSIIRDNPFILDLCSVPLLFVLAVHNIDNIRLSKDTQLNKVSHFMSNMILQLCPTAPEVEGVPLEFCRKGNEMMTLGELAFNGLCKGHHQQLSWQKDFMERYVYNYKLWVDSGILILEEDPIMPERKFPEASETITGHNQVSQFSSLSEFSTTAPAHSTEASKKGRELGGPKSGLTKESVRRTPDQVPLVVKFLHKVIQEWFAAKFFSSKMKSCTEKEEFHNYVTSQLQHIHPADLHYVLRFTSYLHHPSCHVIMNYLRRSYRKGGSVPPNIMDCIFLCFIEHNDDKGPNMRNAVEEVCREVITIQSEDSGLLQQAKSAFVQYACNNEVVIETLQLNDVISSVDRTNLTLNYGLQFGLLHTVKMIKVSRWDPRFQGGDCRKILEFLSACNALKEVCCIFPINPPGISDKMTLNNILSKNMKVEWHIGHCVHSLDPKSGKWELNFKQPGNKCLTEPIDVSVDKETLKIKGKKQSTASLLATTNTQSINRSVPREKKKEKGGDSLTHATLSGEKEKFQAEKHDDSSYGIARSQSLGCYTSRKTISTKVGGTLEIFNTGIFLIIPPDALPADEEEHDIRMRYISRRVVEDPVKCFSSNSTAVVEILPSFRLQRPASLSLPHCLVLRQNSERKAKIFASHHLEGTDPFWKEQQDVSYHVEDTSCILLLNSFSWYKYCIDDEIVLAKKIVVYTAAEKPTPHDDEVRVEVGCFPDLPGQEEEISGGQNLIVAHKKVLYFEKRKKQNPLRIFLNGVYPSEWHCQDRREPTSTLSKEIPYSNISEDLGGSCVFILKMSSHVASLPLCVFTASQDKDEERDTVTLQLAVNLKVLDKIPSTLEVKDHCKTLREEATVTKSGRELEIPGAGVVLKIPPNALKGNSESQLVGMRIISSRAIEDQVTSLSSHFCTAVEVYPHTLTFQQPVELRLPHSLKFDENSLRIARIFTNYQKGNPAIWEEETEPIHHLDEKACVITLSKPCCVQYFVDDNIVRGKQIRLFTAVKGLEHEDEIAELEVGFYPDIPGGSEFLKMNPNFKVDSNKKFLIGKQNFPLQLLLDDITTPSWKCWFPKDNPQHDIPVKAIAASIGHSHLFVIQKTRDAVSITRCLFTAMQIPGQKTELPLTVRPKELHHSSSLQTDERRTAQRRKKMELDSKNRTISILSKKLGKEWTAVCRRLGVENAEIQQQKENFPQNTREAIYQCLHLWKTRKESAATFEVLSDVLRAEDRADLADDVLKYAEFLGDE